jgi:hypothetical protein
MKPIEERALRSLISQWENVKMLLDQLRLPAARPDDGYAIFSLIRDPQLSGQIGFDIAPVTFNVPERATQSPNLYIVADGRIYLDEQALRTERALRILNFATQVGYFRKARNGLDHIYGAHYDFTLDEIGHPIFHAQMRSFNEHASYIAQFQPECASTDYMKHVLRTVRLPSAQMDFFSLVLQICADHLMSKDSGKEERETFSKLRDLSRKIQGAGHLAAAFLQAPPCMRSLHWYS